jgi:hypothetical protein
MPITAGYQPPLMGWELIVEYWWLFLILFVVAIIGLPEKK